MGILVGGQQKLSVGQLADMQEFLSTVLPPFEEQNIFAQGMVGERVNAVNYGFNARDIDDTYALAVQSLQKAFSTFNRIVFLRYHAEMEKNTGLTETPFLLELEDAHNPRFFLAKMLMPDLDRAREVEWRCRVNNAMAATACAVERYRLAHATLPEDLDALVPTFMAEVPTDPFRDDAGPVSYRIREDGSYVIYTWAQNRTDEHAIKPEKGNAWSNGDWTSTVAPLAFRDGPQLTDTPPVDEAEQTRLGLGDRGQEVKSPDS